MTVADRIRERREELGLTQIELAERMGYKTKSSVSKIESAQDKVTLKTVERAATALQCDKEYLMGWYEAIEKKLTGKTPEEGEQELADRMRKDHIFWNYAKMMYFLPQSAKEQVYDFIDFINDKETKDGNR
jgi:transcriptional regulator with XRE-family HTH domain